MTRMLSLRLAAFLYASFVVRDLASAVAFDGFPPTRGDVERGMLSSLRRLKLLLFHRPACASWRQFASFNATLRVRMVLLEWTQPNTRKRR